MKTATNKTTLDAQTITFTQGAAWARFVMVDGVETVRFTNSAGLSVPEMTQDVVMAAMAALVAGKWNRVATVVDLAA